MLQPTDKSKELQFSTKKVKKNMNWFANISIRLKIFSIAIVGIIGFMGYLAYNYNTANANYSNFQIMEHKDFPMLENTNSLQISLPGIKDLFSSAVSTSEAEMLVEAQTLGDNVKSTLSVMAELSSLKNPELQLITAKFTDYFALSNAISTGMIKDTLDFSTLPDKIGQMNALYEETSQLINAFRAKRRSIFIERLNEIQVATKNSLLIGVGLGIAVVSLLIIAANFIAKSVTSSVNDVVIALNEMSVGHGDLSKRISTKSNDEIGKLVTTFNEFVNHLQTLIKETIQVSNVIAADAKQLYENADSSEQNIMQQRENIFLVATAVNQMSSTAKEVANNAAAAANATQQATTETHTSHSIVSNNIKTIDALANEVQGASTVIQNLKIETESIETVLHVIKSIAEQTNLLALNAAIEAARAGEQGRGFAVVADEVRTLAQRTHNSTQEIESMIARLQSKANNAVEVIDRGMNLANISVQNSQSAGESLSHILSAVEVINEMNLQVASAAEQQNKVSEAVNASIEHIGSLADGTVEYAQQTATASRQVAAHANQLDTLVGKFKV